MTTAALPWHADPVAAVVARPGTDPERGVAPEEARRRLAGVGPQTIAQVRGTPLWRLLLAQFESVVVLLLLGAAAVARALGERPEAVAIAAALLLNAAFGFVTERRARLSLRRLRAAAVPSARVRRGGRTLRLSAAELVPGGLVALEAGTRVPADRRLVRSAALRTTEAALTGESGPVTKEAEAALPVETPLAERRTTAYLGIAVVGGRGRGVVVAAGAATELGRIGRLVAEVGARATPLERQARGLGRRLTGLALAGAGPVGVAGVLHGEPAGSC